MPNILKREKYDGVVGIVCGSGYFVWQKVERDGCGLVIRAVVKELRTNAFFYMESLIKTL
jgi:hypothetical protein